MACCIEQDSFQWPGIVLVAMSVGCLAVGHYVGCGRVYCLARFVWL